MRKDRLLGITQGPGIVGNPSVLANVGSVKTNGIETALTWRPMTNLDSRTLLLGAPRQFFVSVKARF